MNGKPMLAAQQLEVTLSGRTVLHDVSLSLPSGQLVALVGPNGAGKTTLLRALAGLVPSTGTIEVGGDHLSSLSLRERAKRFGYLPQGHLVHWPLPAKDVVALGRYPHGATDPARLSPRDEAGRVARDAGHQRCRVFRTPRHGIVRRRTQPGRAGAGAGRRGTGRARGRTDRLARSALPDRRHDQPAQRRGSRRAGCRGDARSRPRRTLCRHRARAVGRPARRARKACSKRFRSRSWPTCSGSARTAPITATRP